MDTVVTKIDSVNMKQIAERLSDVNFFNKLKSFADWLILQDDVTSAYQAIKILEQAVNTRSDLKSIDTKLWQGYNNLLWKFKTVAIPFLSDDDVLPLFQNGLVIALEIVDVNLVDKLEAKLVRILMHEERDIFKKRLREILLNNNDFLFEARQGEHLVRTVGDWLKNYSTVVGAGGTDPFKREQYLAQNSLFHGLEQTQREAIRRLINLFDYLKHSSLTPEGIEEGMSFIEDGRKYIFDKGKVEELNNTDPVLHKFIIFDKETPATLEVKKSIIGDNIEPSVPKVPVLIPKKTVTPSIAQTVFKQQIPIPPPALSKENQFAPQVLKTTEPAFFFNLEDEREVDKLRIPNTELRITSTLEEKLRVLAEDVIKKHNFSFKDEVGKRRFINLFVSHLKDVRNVIEVRETLLKPVTSGGLGLPIDKTEQVIKIIEDAKTQFESRIKNHESAQVVNSKPQTEQEKMQSELDKLMREDVPVAINPIIKPAGPQVVLPKSDKIGELNSKSLPTGRQANDKAQIPNQTQSLNVKIETKPLSEDKFKNWREEMLKEIAKAAPPPPPLVTSQSPIVPSVSPVIRGQEPGASNDIRPQLTDIKAPPRTLGPLEELKSLNLVDFRRLDPSPVEALSKVRAKIDLIGETSISRRLEAVRSWQASPVYQLYLKLGRLSIEQGKAMAEIVAELQGRGEPTLSEAEFNAIIDFNQKIRF